MTIKTASGIAAIVGALFLTGCGFGGGGDKPLTPQLKQQIKDEQKAGIEAAMKDHPMLRNKRMGPGGGAPGGPGGGAAMPGGPGAPPGPPGGTQ